MLELLSPAGSMDALRAAVQNGADAVYLGLSDCNARQGARNFSQDELREAVKYCHIRGVKVHLTLNTLVSDREMLQAAELIRTAAACDVDAFIVQDLGVVQLCRQIAPHIAIHASTQMSLHNLDGVKQAAKMGISRAVLARELSRDEIAYICRNSPIEIEVFVHGALCMCYSGQCYMSAVIGRRSGNRGQCAQPCRLPYGYSRQENKYPLSLKDNCLLAQVKELERLGVASLKIEGRMKRPEYVATATRIYREIIDGAPLRRQHIQDLQTAFSRQGFTQNYYTTGPGPEMLGVRTVEKSSEELYAAARATYENRENPRVPVRFYALVTRQQGCMLAVQDEDGHICKTRGPEPMQAIHRSLRLEDLSVRLAKTGGTPFVCTEVKGVIDEGVTLSAATINAMRRDVLDQLMAVRGRREQARLGQYTKARIYPGTNTAPVLTVSVQKVNQLTAALLRAKPAVLYVPLAELAQHPAIARQVHTETQLVAVLPRVIWDSEMPKVRQQLDLVFDLGIRQVLSGNLGQFSLARSRGFRVRGDFGLNVYNSRTMNWLRSEDLTSACASFEMTLPQIRDLSKAVPLELIAYGRLPLMLTENCIMRNRTGACICQTQQTKLVDRTGEEFPVIKDPGTCRNVILNGKKLYLLDKKQSLNGYGLWALRLQFTTESPAEVSRIVDAWRTGGVFDPGSCTRGLYYRGVE